MAIYDISVPLVDGMPIYPGDPDLQIQDWKALSKGDPANVSFLHFGAHTGTHVDAPAHFIEGAAPIESLPLDVLIGEAQVIEVPVDAASIDQAFVNERYSRGTSRVLFKTRNSAFWKSGESNFHRDFCYLELAAAEQLVANKVRLVGIDYLSIEKFHNEGHPTHLSLLSHGVVIVEGLNLSDVSPGKYELICLPLRIRGGKGDGAPARAVLRTLGD
ncbi:MAG TPA: cyclase family protein [Pyrinomonadaceae bacterium]|jgi:arylformamidase